jgi:hypothetical protein
MDEEPLLVTSPRVNVGDREIGSPSSRRATKVGLWKIGRSAQEELKRELVARLGMP